MIVQEWIGNDLIKSYSDAGVMIRQETGDLYAEAVDIEGLHTYTETDIPILITEDAPEDIAQAARFLLANGLMEFPAQEQPDYFSETEPEPNYFQED